MFVALFALACAPSQPSFRPARERAQDSRSNPLPARGRGPAPVAARTPPPDPVAAAARTRPPDPVPAPAAAPTQAPDPVPAPAVGVVGAPAPSAPIAGEPSRDGWNTAQIAWLPYEAGLARARAENRPIVLVMHAGWCGHCRTYSHVFEDPRIVERARSLVMVRIDTDAEPDIARRYQIDGGYVPRTFFLAPDGTVRAEIDARRPQYRYFFDESDPSSLLAAMDIALGRS